MELHSPQASKVHRISAQKSLSMPDTTTPTSIDLAKKDLLFGFSGAPANQEHAYKAGHKWQNRAAIWLLDDFQKLMVYLFSDHTEESAKYLAASKATEQRVAPPVTKLERIKEVWERILPHRELVLGGLRIQTKVRGGTTAPYNSSEMSDGERVIFYLIGQCLAAPNDGIIIIDEPELHLHKSVQAPLWAEVEKLRHDCLFVYLTHDVDFAASQEAAQKVWLKSFDGSGWEWSQIEEVDGLPDELLLEVLGSRKPVVFVEGDAGSYDVALYRSVLDNFLVIARGSCAEVIQSVRALRANEQLHHLSVYGLIDRDRRGHLEIDALAKDGIFVLQVAEVENIFCTRELLDLASTRLARNPADDFNAIAYFVLERLKSELENQISLRTACEIKYRLSLFDENAKGQNALALALTDLAQGINVGQIYLENKSLFDGLIAKADYDELLKYYNRKSLSSQVSKFLGLSNGELPELIVRLARGQDSTEIRSRLKKYFGPFGAYMP